jgi:benzoate membrane transport protein
VLALVSGALTTLISVAPANVVGAVAGLALLATLGSSLAAALSAERDRLAAALTFVVATSGATFLGVSSAFWALLAGLALMLVMRRPAPAPESERTDQDAPATSGGRSS